MEMLFENLGAWAPSCKDQRADTCWVMAYSHKTQSLMKNGGQQKCLDKALMMYGSWDLRHDSFFVILRDFLTSDTPNNPKNQNFEKMKKSLEILSFYTCVPLMKIIW